MIFNLSQGGVSYITVTAPEGSEITVTCMGVVVTGTGTCTLEVPIVGTWAVSCVFDGVEKTGTIEVTSFGESYEIEFKYGATITVTTFPGSSVTATKTGQTTLTGTADENGECTLDVPTGGLGVWTVTANNGSVTDSGDVDVAAYDISYPITLLPLVPDISIVVGSTTYSYQGAAIDNANVKVSPVGITGWKLWMKSSGTITFNRLPTNVDICAVGKGAGGGYARSSSGEEFGGGGGRGGQIVNVFNQQLTVGTAYIVTISDSGSGFGTIATASKGGGASGGGGGYTNNHAWPSPSHSTAGGGGDGKYAFDDQNFDGTIYGHGGDGGEVGYHGGGRGSTSGVYANNGAGGAGGGTSANSPTDGIDGIVILRGTEG